ncbi:hypothetical protein ACYQR9_15685 [Methylobacterium sp. CM6241]
MRRNVLGWLTGKVPDALHALVLTHNIDFLFLQSVMAPMLRRAGDPRLVVFADAACASQAFAAQSGLLDGLGDRYRVVPVDLGSARRFHPKALLLSGRAGASLAVGSGNLTHGGMSANHEAWAFAATDGEGASLIAALRDYVTSLLPRLPLSEPLSDWLGAVFDREQAWAAELPAPAGLVGSPAASNLLEQIAAHVHEPVRAVEVLAPYHDDRGAALAAVARRFAAPVTCWIQPGRAGLSRAAAEELPATVTLKSIDCEQDRRPSFIHAKVLALRGDARTVLAVGSANCSQAALLAEGSWGNAELMAVEAVRHEVAEALFAGLVRSDVPPPLPESPPSEGWDIPADAPLRILAARFEAGRLRIAYRGPMGVDRVRVVLSGSAQRATELDPAAGVVAFDVPLRPRTVSIEALAPDGTTLVSAEAWVDDEASLSAPATLRRVIQRLRDEGDAAWLPSRTFRDVLELFRDYVCDPQAARRHFERAPPRRGAAQPYDPLDAFSEEFGRPSARAASDHAETAAADLLSIVEALFAVGGAAGDPPAAPSDLGDADGEEPDAEAAEQQLLGQRPPAPDEREGVRLRRALSAMEQALRAPAFVETRTPALLGADLAMAAVLLVKGLATGLLEPSDYRRATRGLWSTLFFGGGDAPGTLTTRIGSIAAPDRDAFMAALCSPRLSAALALWSATEWAAEDADALWFRLSAAVFHQAHPSLFGGGSAESVLAELDRWASRLLPPNDRLAATRAWLGTVRAGEALRLLSDAIGACPDAELRSATSSERVEPSTLVWVHGRLGFPTAPATRGAKSKVHVQFLGQQTPKPYRTNFLVPIRDVLQAGVLTLPPMVADEVGKLSEAAVAARSDLRSGQA